MPQSGPPREIVQEPVAIRGGNHHSLGEAPAVQDVHTGHASRRGPAVRALGDQGGKLSIRATRAARAPANHKSDNKARRMPLIDADRRDDNSSKNPIA